MLVVEDEASVRNLAVQILRAFGYRVLVARDGAEALEVSARHDGPIHLLLTDVVMPCMSGKDLAQQLRSRRPELRVLYMSGYTDNAIVRHGILEPGTAFLRKPFTLESLTQKARAVLADGA